VSPPRDRDEGRLTRSVNLNHMTEYPAGLSGVRETETYKLTSPGMSLTYVKFNFPELIEIRFTVDKHTRRETNVMLSMVPRTRVESSAPPHGESNDGISQPGY